MLHILLLILKIIGIIIAVILGLIIVLGLIILFVPIRYSIDTDYHKKPVAYVKVTWLLHLLRGVVSYDEQLDISVKVLQFTLYSNNSEEEQEKSQDKSKFKNKFHKKSKDKSKNETQASEGNDLGQVSATSYDDKGSIIDENIKLEQETDIDTIESDSNNNFPNQIITNENDITTSEATILKEQSQDNTDENKVSKKGISDKISAIIDKIKGLYYKFKENLIKLYNTLKGVINKSQASVNKVKQKYNEIREKVTDPENIELVKFLWKQAKAGLKIIKPSKYDINIRYGFEDSAITGWLAVRLAIIYGFLGIDMNIIPDFDNSIFEGRVYMKGSFNIFSILIIAIRLYRNKSFRKLINK